MNTQRLVALGELAGDLRRAIRPRLNNADCQTPEEKRITAGMEAEYAHYIERIDTEVIELKAANPKHFWHPDDPQYKALKAKWKAEREARLRVNPNDDKESNT